MPRSKRSAPADPATLAARVQRNLVRRCGIRRGDRLLIGVSAGADSVALLGLLADIAPRLGLALEVAHFDHALRADSSDDARFVAQLAAAHGLEFHLARWDAPRPGEAAAREARHAFLRSTAGARACNAIALAHHLDDQIETAILRLERGSGLRGAGGMAWRRAGEPPFVRPLLDVRRSTLRLYLETTGQSWREDASNADTTITRNRVRVQVLPALDAALRDGWMERWGAELEELRSVSAWIDRMALELLSRAAVRGRAGELHRPPLRDAPEAVRRRALHRWLDSAWRHAPPGTRPASRKQMIRRQLEELSRIVRTGRNGQSIDLPGGWALRIESGCVRLASPEFESAATDAPEYRLDVRPVHDRIDPRAEGATHGSSRESRPELPRTAAAWVDGGAVEPPVRLRHPEPGDAVRLLGAPGRRKLSRIFQDREIPPRLRAAWPVVADRNGILWVPGVGVADRAKLSEGTRETLRLHLEIVGKGPSDRPADLVQDAEDH